MAKANESGLVVGYKRLPGNVSEGSRAFFNKIYTREARGSMAGVISRFQQFIDGLKKSAPDALYQALLPTFEKAQTYCPKKTGALVASGHLESGMNASGRAFARISFGGGGVIHYAAIVHERTDFHHAPPTRSKYLQAAVEEDLGKMKARFAASIKKTGGA